MTSTAITADAVGISDTATRKTGSVVEQLLAPADVRVEQIRVDLIEPHPRNRKILDEDVADLVAGLKAGEPILNPLGVTAAADWNASKPADLKEIGPLHFIITAGGHRRLRAAELAGLSTVPCIVRSDFAGAKGRRAALLENLQRLDLDPFDEAAAFGELTGDYKISQRDLAAAVGCNQSHISKRLKLLKLPSAVREAVRVGQMPIGDALDLAGVVDNKPVFEDALDKVKRGGWSAKQAVARAQGEYDRRVARQRVTNELTDSGAKILSKDPSWWPSGKDEPTKLDALELDDKKHAEEPCHAVHVAEDYRGVRAIGACEHPRRHMKAGDSKLKVRKSVEDQMNSRGRSNDTEAKTRRERKELKKLWPGRATIARQLAVGQTELDADAERELITRGMLGNTFHGEGHADVWKALVAILGFDDAGAYPNEESTDKLLQRLPVRTVQRAVALAYFEARLRSTWKQWGSDGQYYLDLLVGHGYTLDRLEKSKLPRRKPAKASDVDDTTATAPTSDDEHAQLLEASEAVG